MIAAGWSPLFTAGIDWLEGLLPILFVGFWIVSQIVAVIRKVSGPVAANRPEPVRPAPRPVAGPPADPLGDRRSELERQIAEFLGQSPGREVAPPRAMPKPPPQPRRPDRPRMPPSAPPKVPPPLPRGRDTRVADRHLVATGDGGADVARHVHDAFAHELGHLAPPLTEAASAAKAKPATGRIEELVAAVRDPTRIRELMLLREILDRPIDRWS